MRLLDGLLDRDTDLLMADSPAASPPRAAALQSSRTIDQK